MQSKIVKCRFLLTAAARLPSVSLACAKSAAQAELQASAHQFVEMPRRTT